MYSTARLVIFLLFSILTRRLAFAIGWQALWFLHDLVAVLTHEPFQARHTLRRLYRSVVLPSKAAVRAQVVPLETRRNAVAALNSLYGHGGGCMRQQRLQKSDILLQSFLLDRLLAAAERWPLTEQHALAAGALGAAQDIVLARSLPFAPAGQGSDMCWRAQAARPPA